ncbi:molybdenum cofactor biosynthetic protein A1 [Pseudomonas knackmussii B13]|uniref:Molybdopterin molybdenumtransferase n=1 Tax=Pseudomonas knackmussii (strain DSM 6978 / CCUG 54928 / LMG 23759 / B13) TaxID=1301098 RepID=A0A024HBT8_PSEKB|nr:gephyrin-like molybdotransferase Glp [Pseudomonas knackmussii]CDF82341.1 molybdenum cofactor biosynthetic protein A1 [Pseudomonas knackmussii B13]
MSGCGCASGGLLPVELALEALLARVPAAPPVESVGLDQAMGRVLAEDIRAPADLPAWDNSAMDGYALRAEDARVPRTALSLAGSLAAGQSRRKPLQPGQALRIFTGAPLPPGADTVIAQEDCQLDGEWVVLPAVRQGSHVRRRGEEMRQGDCLLRRGTRLRAQEIGLLASIGLARVPVHRRLRVCLLSSGDELRAPGEALAAGQIHDVNRFSLGALIRGWGMELHDYGVLADTLAASRDALSLAASEWDLLITSGGVSVGERDYLKQAVRELGELHLWRIAMQPGKPLAFGQVAGKPWLGLPGNPAAAFVTALVLARPFLWAAQGRPESEVQALSLPAGFAWPQANPRRQYLRARLEADGQVHIHAQQGSAMLRAASWANGLAVVEAGRTLEEGEAVEFLPFGELMG